MSSLFILPFVTFNQNSDYENPFLLVLVYFLFLPKTFPSFILKYQTYKQRKLTIFRLSYKTSDSKQFGHSETNRKYK